MGLRLFCDTNVLFSFVYSYPKDSISGVIFDLHKKEKFDIYISELVRLEALKNISLKAPSKVELLYSTIKTITILENISPPASFYPDMPLNDRVILYTAISSKVEVFITGNSRDFSNLYHRKLEKTLILPPRDFVEKKW